MFKDEIAVDGQTYLLGLGNSNRIGSQANHSNGS